MCRISIIYASGTKSVITDVLSDIDFLWRDENFCGLTMFRIIFQRPQFPIRGAYFSNQLTYSVLFLHFLTRSPLYFYFRSVCSNFLKRGTLVTLANWALHQIWSSSITEIWTFTSDTLRYIVTLSIDLLTLSGCQKFFVTRSNPPPTLSILRLSWVLMFTLWLLLAIQIAYYQLYVHSITWPICEGLILTTFLKSVTPICLFILQLL